MSKLGNYEQLLAGLSTSREYQTLSGRKFFTAMVRSGELHIDPPDLHQKAFRVSRGIYELVRRRFESLPEEKQMARKNYVKPAWAKTPGSTVAPLIAAIVAAESAGRARQAIREIIEAGPKSPDKSGYEVSSRDRSQESQAD